MVNLISFIHFCKYMQQLSKTPIWNIPQVNRLIGMVIGIVSPVGMKGASLKGSQARMGRCSPRRETELYKGYHYMGTSETLCKTVVVKNTAHLQMIACCFCLHFTQYPNVFWNRGCRIVIM